MISEQTESQPGHKIKRSLIAVGGERKVSTRNRDNSSHNTWPIFSYLSLTFYEMLQQDKWNVM